MAGNRLLKPLLFVMLGLLGSAAAESTSQAGPPAAPVYVTIELPNTGAQLWFEDTLTPQNGPVRHYESPPLTKGQTYTYEVRAHWVEGGRDVQQTKMIEVYADERVLIHFSAENVSPVIQRQVGGMRFPFGSPEAPADTAPRYSRYDPYRDG